MGKNIVGKLFNNAKGFNVVHIYKRKGVYRVNIQEFRDGEPYRRGVVMDVDQLDAFMKILRNVKARVRLDERGIIDESI